MLKLPELPTLSRYLPRPAEASDKYIFQTIDIISLICPLSLASDFYGHNYKPHSIYPSLWWSRNGGV